MLDSIDFSLTPAEIIFALVAGYIITKVIQFLLNVGEFIKINPREFSYNSENMNNIINRCYALFPQEILKFGDEEFKRGMKVQITTFQNKTFEGEFIGSNKDRDMLCIITKNRIIAHEIQNIETIKALL